MRTLKILFSFLLLVSLSSFAQVPQGFTYQSVLRDATGNILPNLSNLPVRFKIFQGADSVYIETHTASTNEFGVLTRTVGQGTPVTGTFSSVNWSTGNFSLKVEINFGTGYENMGTNQLFTVPFSMISRNIASDVPGNLFVGFDAGKSNAYLNDTTGNANTFLGSLAGYTNTVGAFNVAVGREALYTSSSSDENTAVGGRALFSNTVGDANTALGRSALYNNSDGNSNTAIGVRTLYSNTTGDANTALGRSALSNSNGSNNTAFGRSTLFTNTTGSSNVAIGVRALYNNTANSNLVAIGDSALFSNAGITPASQGYGNTAVGSRSLYANTTGTRNTGLGYRSGDTYATGSACTYLGYNADASTSGLFNANAIGCDAVVSASNNFVFGNSSVIGWGFGTSPAGNAIKVGTGPSNGNGAFLTVGGAWTAADYNYSASQTHYASFPPVVFVSRRPFFYDIDVATTDEYCYFATAGVAYGYASVLVSLPDGANITELRAWLYDDDATYLTRVSLSYLSLGTNAATQITSVQTTDAGVSASIQNLSSATAHTVNNSSNAYYLYWQGELANTNTRLYGVRITYTVAKPN